MTDYEMRRAVSIADLHSADGYRRLSTDAVAEMVRIRRDIHAQPETAFCEYRTADLIAKSLEKLGMDVHRGLAETGVVGTLRRGTSHKVIGLRADMDALPMQERNVFAHRSQIAGKMHACGHDGHIAMLLGAARALSNSETFDGTVKFIFQPAEENEAGAKRMIEEGLFAMHPVDGVFGMHNMPSLPAGRFYMKSGAMMAAADFFQISIAGKGSHAGWPHQGDDLIAVGSEITMGVNRIAARTVDPLAPSVISVTMFNAGTSMNVMPDKCVLGGTVRTLSENVRDAIEQEIHRFCAGLARAHGVEVTVDYDRRYPVLINSPGETELAVKAAGATVGRASVFTEVDPVMGAEDFAWMLQEKPGSLVWIGSGDLDGSAVGLHNPSYDFNDAVLPIGALYWVNLVQTCLVRSP